jgi:hypothetical protein
LLLPQTQEFSLFLSATFLILSMWILCCVLLNVFLAFYPLRTVPSATGTLFLISLFDYLLLICRNGIGFL